MNTATYIKTLDGWRGEARLYKVDPPMAYGWGDDEGTTEYVVVSAVVVPYIGGAETYIFPAREDGSVIEYGEMEGSFRGALDHEQALENAGY